MKAKLSDAQAQADAAEQTIGVLRETQKLKDAAASSHRRQGLNAEVRRCGLERVCFFLPICEKPI